MIGDRILIYNPDKGEFYTGRDQAKKIFMKVKAPLQWSRRFEKALMSTDLKTMQRIKEEAGGNATIISETRGRQISEAFACREVKSK